MPRIETLCQDFDITPADIESRYELSDYLNSLASVLVDEFYTSYLKNKPDLMRFMEKSDGSMMLKKLKEFVVFLLSAPVDEAYFERIEKIGFVHFGIGLPPSKVSYGFWAIHQLLGKMAEVNERVKSAHALISKFFFLAEFVMNDSYYANEFKHNAYSDNVQVPGSFDALYNAYALHQQKHSEVLERIRSGGDLQELRNAVVRDAHECPVGVALERMGVESSYLKSYNFDIASVKALHVKWHETLYEMLDSNESTLNPEQVSTLETLFAQMKALVDAPIQQFGDTNFMALNATIKAIRAITELFYSKPAYGDERDDTLPSKIRKVFEAHFSWAIDALHVNEEKIPEVDFDLYRPMSFHERKLFVGISIAAHHKEGYLTQMLSLLLQAMEMNLSIYERERSLMQFADKAESANRAKDVFLANMSHELRTPLNAISGFSQILLARPDTPESVKNYVQKINVAGNNLLDLVNTILDFAKLESGKMPFKPRLSNIGDVINEVEVIATPLAMKKNITLRMPAIQSLNLLLDPNLIKQVLLNLLSNAIKFTPEAGTVSLQITHQREERAYLFSVCDTGVGIAKELQHQLFQPFLQIENSYQKEHKGTGLGLMISKKIIEEFHKGRIWVESEEGKGSCFYINLPIPSTESHTFVVSESSSGKRMLVVEDSPEYQQIFVDNLKDAYEVTVTNTVNRAKELLISNRFDAIILDFFLTDGVGSEVLQFMDEENIDIPCMMVSAEQEIEIAKSLAGSNNLILIMNKEDVQQVCKMLQDHESRRS